MCFFPGNWDTRNTKYTIRTTRSPHDMEATKNNLPVESSKIHSAMSLTPSDSMTSLLVLTINQKCAGGPRVREIGSETNYKGNNLDITYTRLAHVLFVVCSLDLLGQNPGNKNK